VLFTIKNLYLLHDKRLDNEIYIEVKYIKFAFIT